MLDVRHLLGAASLLLLASACETGKRPRANAAATVQQASPAPTQASLADAEADYLSTKRAYLASLDAEKKRGTPDSVLDAREAAALHDLAARLRRILGSFDVEGADSGTANVTTLVPQMDFGALDGIAYHFSDSTLVVVTTRALLDAWLRDPVAGDTTLPRDPASALARTELYEQGIPEDAAVAKYTDVPVNGAAESGVVAAMLANREQDIGPFTPREVIVSVLRGNRVYLVEAPARVLIEPMVSCKLIWGEAESKWTYNIEAGQRATDTIARRSSFRIADKLENQGDTLVRQCYAEHVQSDPRFAALVEQVGSIVRRLPLQ